MGWETFVKKQNADLTTDKVREDLQLSLTDLQIAVLKDFAYKAGFKKPGDFLSSFVGDLTGWHSNGSDERDLAGRWYERAFYPWLIFFRHHLFCRYDLEAMRDMLENTDYFEDVYNDYKSEVPKGTEFQSREDCLNILKEIVEGGKEL